MKCNGLLWIHYMVGGTYLDGGLVGHHSSFSIVITLLHKVFKTTELLCAWHKSTLQTKKCGTRFVSGCQYQTLKFSLLWVWQKFSMWSLSLQVFMPMQDLHVNEVPESRIITIMNINCVFMTTTSILKDIR